MGGLLWSNLLEILYKERKTDSIPIQCLTIFFRQMNCTFNSKYVINNFMINDNFIQYLTEEEIDKSLSILLHKKNLYLWLNSIYIPNFIWLITRLSKFLPYDFTRTKILNLINDQYCSREAILSMSHLKVEDYNKVKALYLLNDLKE